jgi:uncharacterized protein (TIGR00645 family)
MQKLEWLIERLIVSSRWLLVMFYLGLAVALGVYGISFCIKLISIASNTFKYSPNEMILAMLTLIDAALVASLIVMVMISGYENFVSRFDEDKDSNDVAFMGKLDAGSLKIKVASSIVAISSIHMLQVFLNIDSFADNKVLWTVILHMAFVVSALIMSYLESMNKKSKTQSSIKVD